jgi:hypothetical protein
MVSNWRNNFELQERDAQVPSPVDLLWRISTMMVSNAPIIQYSSTPFRNFSGDTVCQKKRNGSAISSTALW